tara:strand:- start:168 stop:419 length:252 start_codon:yes stop_codon:yes gene_type:complete
MSQKPLSELTDQELLQEAKKRKTTAIIDALTIGFLFGVIVYSVFNKSWGVLTLIPIYMIYKLVNKPKYDKKELESLLRQRNLR